MGGSVVASKLKKESTPADVVFISGGTYRMGSDRHYPEEAPSHRVTVSDFWIDRTPVTDRQFRKFVNETGYVTFAELRPDAKDYPGALPHMLKAGSLVFTPRKHPVDLTVAMVEVQIRRLRELRFLPPEHQNSTQSAQRRLTPVGADLLPPLSSGVSSRATGRYVHKPCRIPACHQKMER